MNTQNTQNFAVIAENFGIWRLIKSGATFDQAVEAAFELGTDNWWITTVVEAALLNGQPVEKLPSIWFDSEGTQRSRKITNGFNNTGHTLYAKVKNDTWTCVYKIQPGETADQQVAWWTYPHTSGFLFASEEDAAKDPMLPATYNEEDVRQYFSRSLSDEEVEHCLTAFRAARLKAV